MEIHNNAKPELNSELDNNVDLFDVLLTLAENFRLLILGSLLAGACAYGLAFLLPPKYESTSVLRAEPSVAAYMTTPSVLDATLQKLGYLDGLDGEKAEDARESLARHVEARAGRNDKLVTLTVTGRSPEAAQSLNREILTWSSIDSRKRKPHWFNKRKSSRRPIKRLRNFLMKPLPWPTWAPWQSPYRRSQRP